MSGLDVHVADSFDRVAERVVAAWQRAERGDAVDENHVTFMSWGSLARVMTEERFGILRYLHKSPTPSIAALAAELQLDPKSVRDDVEALVSAGLVEHSEVGLRRTMTRSGP